MQKMALEDYDTKNHSQTSMDGCSRADIEDARRLIDEEIAKLKEAIRRLRSRRNLLAPVSKLPPEVLSTIFGLIAAEQQPPIKSMSWVRFSQASQMWRDIALSSPSLWTTIPFNYPKWANEMLRRSKVADLTFSGNFWPQRCSSHAAKFSKSLFNHFSRIREINISGIDTPVIETVFSRVSRCPPRLDCFRLHGPPAYVERNVTLPKTALCGSKNLRRLELVRCDFDWDPQFLCGLTFLKVHHTSSSSQISTAQFIDALQGIPALEYLDLRYSLPKVALDTIHSTLNLPKIRRLRLASTMAEVANLFCHIILPSSAILELSCTGKDSPATDFLRLLLPLAALYSATNSETRQQTSLQSFSISSRGRYHLTVKAWTSPPTGDFSGQANAEPSLILEVSDLKLARTRAQSALLAISRSLPLENLKMLHLDARHFPSTVWVDAFGGPNSQIRWARVDNNATEFIKALKHNSEEDSVSELGRVSFPRLCSLWMNKVGFHSEADTDIISVETLQDIFMERYERGAEVQTLTLTKCYNVSEAGVKLLGEIVPDVIWNGVEDIDDYDDYCSADYLSR